MDESVGMPSLSISSFKGLRIGVTGCFLSEIQLFLASANLASLDCHSVLLIFVPVDLIRSWAREFCVKPSLKLSWKKGGP